MVDECGFCYPSYAAHRPPIEYLRTGLRGDDAKYGD
jgi:hypothetical protein